MGCIADISLIYQVLVEPIQKKKYIGYRWILTRNLGRYIFQSIFLDIFLFFAIFLIFHQFIRIFPIFRWVKASQSQQNAGWETRTWSLRFRNRTLHHQANMLFSNIMADILCILCLHFNFIYILKNKILK